jgi:hypothetical protein
MPRRKANRADEIRAELERMRKANEEGVLSNPEYAAQSARLLHELNRVSTQRRYAET